MTTIPTMSPSDIEVLLHYYCSRLPHERCDAPAVMDAVAKFRQAGLMDKDNMVTDGGRMLIEALCNTPLPVLRWTMPHV